MAARITFASMVHRGFLADAGANTSVTVAVSGKEPIVRNVPMMTAGDVVGIPERQVIRCAPLNGVADAEPNLLATIEFDSPDLPWLYSRKPTSGPIQPWIALAVIDVTDLDREPLSASAVGSQLTIAATELPNPAEAWMWAHAQLFESDTVPDDPDRSLSRLVGSRKLEPHRRYLACVVPVFAAGRIAGLGLDPGDARISLDFAWDPTASEVMLPVYYHWRFSTGADVDFESLVRQLHGVPLPPELGKRRLVLDDPSSGLPMPEVDGSSVELQVALRPPGASLEDIQPRVGTSYLDALRARLVDAGYDTSLLTSNPDAPPPAVGPPVYGQLAAGGSASAANLPTIAPPWVRSANLDPRMRVAAGLGAEVVRQNQERYVQEAWRQVGDVLAANALRRRAEFSVAASATLHRKWISRMSAVDLITSTAPVHSRVFVSESLTITGRLRQSPVPPAIASVEYRRVTRARGRLSGAAAWRASVGPAVLAARSSSATPLTVAVPIDTIDTFDAPSKVWGAAAASSILAKLSPGLDQRAMSLAQIAARLDSMNRLPSVAFATARQAEARSDGTDADRVLTAAGLRRTAHASVSRETLTTLKRQMTEVATVIIDRQIVASDAAPLPVSSLAGGFESLRQTLVAALDPATTMARSVNHRITALNDEQAVRLDDIMAAPDLSEPTYQALAALSHDWLLPGIDTLPPGTTTLVESNRTFISSFLVGMNHELARELLWREYPTDQRGTYSRQFWARRDTLNPADQYDLRHALHASPQLTLEQLGERPGEVASPLVLVVKGELVRRYPGMLVTVAKTKVSGSIRALDPATEIQPDFMARLEPDVLLVGFESISADDIRSLAGNENTAWWFFFAEHFTEPKFGLDLPDPAHTAAVADWNDATWQDAAVDSAARLHAGSFSLPPLPKSKPGTPPGPAYDWHGSSASIAWILLQYPFRRGMRAVDLLPPRSTP